MKTEKEKMMAGENTIQLIIDLSLIEHEQIEYVLNIIREVLMR